MIEAEEEEEEEEEAGCVCLFFFLAGGDETVCAQGKRDRHNLAPTDRRIERELQFTNTYTLAVCPSSVPSSAGLSDPNPFYLSAPCLRVFVFVQGTRMCVCVCVCVCVCARVCVAERSCVFACGCR